MASIFISYRQADSEGHVGRLYDHLKKVYAEKEIFRDLDSLRGGEEFSQACEDAIGACKVFLPVIGPRWIDIRDNSGRRRLDNPNDLVRREISTALKLNKRIIPVLVERAKIPAPTDLPKEISRLFDHKVIEISPERFEYDVHQLINGIGGGKGLVKIFGQGAFGLSAKHRVFIDRRPTKFHTSGSFLDLPLVNFPIEAQVESGVHKMYAEIFDIFPNSDGSYAGGVEYNQQRSNEITFEVKAGQEIEFLLELDTSPHTNAQLLGKRRLTIKPYTSIYKP